MGQSSSTKICQPPVETPKRFSAKQSVSAPKLSDASQKGVHRDDSFETVSSKPPSYGDSVGACQAILTPPSGENSESKSLNFDAFETLAKQRKIEKRRDEELRYVAAVFEIVNRTALSELRRALDDSIIDVIPFKVRRGLSVEDSNFYALQYLEIALEWAHRHGCPPTEAVKKKIVTMFVEGIAEVVASPLVTRGGWWRDCHEDIVGMLESLPRLRPEVDAAIKPRLECKAQSLAESGNVAGIQRLKDLLPLLEFKPTGQRNFKGLASLDAP